MTLSALSDKQLQNSAWISLGSAITVWRSHPYKDQADTVGDTETYQIQMMYEAMFGTTRFGIFQKADKQT